MENRTPQLIIMISGSVAIVAGIVMLCVQLMFELTSNSGTHLATTRLGLAVLTTGAIMEIVGYAATLPWRQRRIGRP